MIVDDLKLVQKFKALLAKAERDANASVVTGYNSKLALILHELGPGSPLGRGRTVKTLHRGEPRPSGLGVRWGPSLFGPKFLEAPARELAQEVASIVRIQYQKGVSLIKCLKAGALRIIRESTKRVPHERGDLQRSWFVEEE